jgi:small subunit ribosomal protein S9
VADYTWGTGRRKTSVARVRLKEGKGQIEVNGKKVEEFFNNREMYINRIQLPLKVTDNLSKYDIFINVFGGGLTGAAGAASLGIARALVKLDETNKSSLKRNGLLTRDPRMVERKKYGLKKARKSEQYSKR